MILIYHAAVYLLHSVVSEVSDVILFAVQISIESYTKNYIYLWNILRRIFLSYYFFLQHTKFYGVSFLHDGSHKIFILMLRHEE
jgi:hypothetical protein